MEHRSVILMIGIMAFMGWYGCSHTPKIMIRKIGINAKHYPEGYIMPSRRFRYFFKLEKKKIPKWIYFELCLSIAYVLYFLLFLIIYFVVPNKYVVVQTFMMIYSVLIILNSTYVVISSCRYR